MSQPEGQAPEGYLEAWDRQPGESSKAYGVFCVYRDLGVRRSLKAACQKFYAADYGPAKLRNCQEWSRHWDWVSRAQAWDGHLDREARIGQAEAVKEMNKRHAAVAKAAIGKVIQALNHTDPKEMGPQDIARLLDLATKIERLCMGEATEHTKQDVKTEGHHTLEVVERIVTAGDRPGKPPELPPATGGADAAVLELEGPDVVVDDGTGEPPDFALPEEPPGARH